MSQELLEHFLQFKSEPSSQTKAKLAGDICDYYNKGSFKESERTIVNEILEYLARDIEVVIRKTISEKLKSNPQLPHDIALQLAKDVEAVACPILEFSEVLTDDDLAAIIRSSREATKLTAVAKRTSVSSFVSLELVKRGVEESIKALVNNQNAAIDDEAMHRIVDGFTKSESILGLMVKRGNLSMAVAERLVSAVSEEMGRELAERYRMTPMIAENMARDAGEETMITVVSAHASSKERVQELVKHLHHSGKLTHSVVLRALCKGDIEFFESGIALLANVPVANARRLIEYGDRKALEAVFSAAAMPYTVLEATFVVLKIVKRLTQNGTAHFRSEDVMEEIVSGGYDRKVPNMPYVLALISKNRANASVNA